MTMIFSLLYFTLLYFIYFRHCRTEEIPSATYFRRRK